MPLVSIDRLSTKPDKLVLTKVEILAALAPIQALADRIKETHGLFDAWHETLPTSDDNEIIGYVPDEDQVVIDGGDLDLWDTLKAFASRDFIYGNAGPLWRLMNDVNCDPVINAAIEERDREEKDAAKQKRAAKAAEARTRNAQAKRERDAEKDRRIAELEAQLASKKPNLTVVS